MMNLHMAHLKAEFVIYKLVINDIVIIIIHYIYTSYIQYNERLQPAVSPSPLKDLIHPSVPPRHILDGNVHTSIPPGHLRSIP